MFKNTVFKANVNTKKWAKAALIRAVRTVAQAAIAGIGTAATMRGVDWRYVLSASAISGVLSILTSIATGLPEAKENQD